VQAEKVRNRPILLVLRALKLGDLLVAVPALKALRRQHEDHRIVLAAPLWLKPIVSLVDAVDELLPTPGLDEPIALPAGVVDIAANLHGNGIESQNRVLALDAGVSMLHRVQGRDLPENADRRCPPWIEDMHERERWVRLVESFGARGDPDAVRIKPPAIATVRPGAIVVHVGAAYRSRHWPIENFASVVRGLAAFESRVVVTGGKTDLPRAEQVAERSGIEPSAMLAGRLGLGEFAALIAEASLVISVDTGAAHLASAYATPSVVLFGPAKPERWGPPPGPHTVLTHADRRRGAAFADRPDPALLAVTPDEVIAAAASLLRTERDPARPVTPRASR